MNLERVHIRLTAPGTGGWTRKGPQKCSKGQGHHYVALGTFLHLSGSIYKTDDAIVCWGYGDKILEMEWLKQRWYCLIILEAEV